MNILTKTMRALWPFEKKTSSLEDAFRSFGLPTANIGMLTTSPEEALRITTVWCAVRVIAEGIAQIPWKVFRRTDKGRETVRDHPIYDLIACSPNDLQTSFEFRETIAFHASLTGDALVFLDRVGNDQRVVSMTPITPSMRMIKFKDGRPHYFVRNETGSFIEIDRRFIWHIKGPSWNNWSGLGVVQQAARALGLAASMEDAHVKLFKNGVSTSGLLSVDGPLSEERYNLLKKYIETQFTNENRSRPMLVDNGARWFQNQMSGVDAQHLESRKLQVEEIARALRVQPIMLMQADKAATFASAEQMFRVHVVHTLSPWYARLEQSADKTLFTTEERAQGLYTKFLPNGLMRGSAKDRAEFYSRALGSGGSPAWMTQNEVREAEDMDVRPEGDQLFSPPKKDERK